MKHIHRSNTTEGGKALLLKRVPNHSFVLTQVHCVVCEITHPAPYVVHLMANKKGFVMRFETLRGLKVSTSALYFSLL